MDDIALAGPATAKRIEALHEVFHQIRMGGHARTRPRARHAAGARGEQARRGDDLLARDSAAIGCVVEGEILDGSFERPDPFDMGVAEVAVFKAFGEDAAWRALDALGMGDVVRRWGAPVHLYTGFYCGGGLYASVWGAISAYDSMRIGRGRVKAPDHLRVFARARGRPLAIVMRPESSSSSRAMQLPRVDLPEPVRPHTPSLQRAGTSNETPRSTSGSPLSMHTKALALIGSHIFAYEHFTRTNACVLTGGR